MATPKDGARNETTFHLEDVSDSKKQHHTEEEVLGRDFTLSESELPDGYFTSANFLGSSKPCMPSFDHIMADMLAVFAIGASFGCGVGGFGLAAPVLGFINADIGPDPNLSWVALSYLLTNSIGLMLVGRLSDLFGTPT